MVVDGVDEDGEDVVGRNGVLEKGKFGNVDLIGGKVGGEVGWVDKPSFELGFEFEEVGCRGGSVLCSHSLHDNRDCYCCHSKHRVGDEGTVGWPDGLEQDGGEFGHSNLMGVDFFQLPLVGTNEGVSGVGGRGDWLDPCWHRADDYRRTSGLDVGGVGCPLRWCEHVGEEAVDAVGFATCHRDEHGAFKPIWIATSGVVIQSGSNGLGGGGHFFRKVGGGVGVGFCCLISSVDIY